MNTPYALPHQYKPYRSLDITREGPNYVIINTISAFLFLIFLVIAVRVTPYFRPDYAGFEFGGFNVWQMLLVFAGMYLIMGVHEAIHALFFWLFSGKFPSYRIRRSVPRTEQPGVYYPRAAFVLVKISGLILISLLAFLVLPLIPLQFVIYYIFLLVGNAAYSAADVWLVAVVLKAPDTVRVEDKGTKVDLYLPEELIPPKAKA